MAPENPAALDSGFSVSKVARGLVSEICAFWVRGVLDLVGTFVVMLNLVSGGLLVGDLVSRCSRLGLSHGGLSTSHVRGRGQAIRWGPGAAHLVLP